MTQGLEWEKVVAIDWLLIFGAGTSAYIALIVRVAGNFTKSTTFFHHEKRYLLKASVLFQVLLFAWMHCNTTWSWKLTLLVHVGAAGIALALAKLIQRRSQRSGGLTVAPLIADRGRKATLSACVCAMMFVL
ncbi:MAG TPA: hypothetical protein VFO38_06380 [Candidatus Saccharimonadales bacterium]|nr:hypothetical protein [Candidatus Saccharimonadales bacterium]